MRTRTVLLAGAGLAAGAAAFSAARSTRRWAAAHDPLGADGVVVDGGEVFEVHTSDGAVLVGRILGDPGRPTVVLPHCWTGSSAIWSGVARRLVANGCRVVLYDQRGHGLSSRGEDGPAGFAMQRLGEDLREVITTLGLTDVVLGGHSMGGMTIQALAQWHPDLFTQTVRGVALVATSAVAAQSPIRPLMLKVVASPAVERAMRRPGVGARSVRGTVGRTPRTLHLEETRRSFVDTPGDIRAGFLAAMFEMDLREGHAVIEVPTHILVGSRDTLTPVRLARQLADGISGSTLEIIPGAGHMLPLEEPDRVAEVIVDLVGATRPG